MRSLGLDIGDFLACKRCQKWGCMVFIFLQAQVMQKISAAFLPCHSATPNFSIHTPLGNAGNHKGDNLRNRYGKPYAGQLQHWWKNQKHQKRIERLGIYKKIGQSILFRCVEIGSRNADKRQKQQRCEEKRKILNDPGICLRRSTKQNAYFCSCKIDADHTDYRNHSSGQICQLSGSPNGRLVFLSVILTDQRLAAVAHSLQQQIENRGNIADTAVA